MTGALLIDPERNGPGMAVDEIRVSTATTHWADTQAVDRLFDSIPDADAARLRLKPGSFLQMYDAVTKRDLWIARDDAIVRCVTIAGIDRETGARVRAEFHTSRASISMRSRLLLFSQR